MGEVNWGRSRGHAPGFSQFPFMFHLHFRFHMYLKYLSSSALAAKSGWDGETHTPERTWELDFLKHARAGGARPALSGEGTVRLR